MHAKKTFLIVSLVIVILIGILSRLLHTGILVFDKYLGDALYAIMFYLLLSIIWHSGNALWKAFIITILTIAIELFQLTLIPLQFRLSDSFVLKNIAILLGTKFSWFDIIAYLVGILVIYIVDQFYLDKFDKIDRSFNP